MSQLIVQKFGGTSVADTDHIKNVALKIEKEIKKNNKVVVVTSAMSGVTTKLIEYTKEVSNLHTDNSLAEYDSVIASGEQITSGLIALCLQSMGYKARSFLGWQAGIITNNSFSKSRIETINTEIFHKSLDNGVIPIVAGFQGVSNEKRITTMGRGGSDTSAVALAAALKADRCDIYTDVTGIFTTDPRITKKARKLKKVAYEEIMEMASLGAKVLQIRSVEMAMKYHVNLQVLSSFHDEEGSLLVNEEEIMERRMITAVTASNNEARITLLNVKNTPGVCANIFKPLADGNINIDMIVQNISVDSTTANITFTLHENELNKAKSLLQNAMQEQTISYEKMISTKDVAKVSVIGIAMKEHAGIAQKTFQTLAKQNINILAITTSEIKISILIDKKDSELAVVKLHDAFELEKPN